jgi:tetratricopeptide (TPR) repeat protein
MPRTTTYDLTPILLEEVRTLAFRGAYGAALEALESQNKLTPALEAWRGLLLIFTGDLSSARRALTNALARGYRGALAGLSVVQRLSGETRDALLELNETALEGLDDFDRANLEREAGLLYEEREDLPRARAWLERAWHTALIGPYGQYQLASIAQPLGRVLGRMGCNSEGIATLDEGLRHVRHDRRVSLLFERAQCHLNLMNTLDAEEDLEELRVFVADRGDLKLLHRYLEAQLQHARGEESDATQSFELVSAFAASMESSIAREVRFFSLLSLLRLHTDSDAHLGRVPELLQRIRPLATTPYRRAWLELRRARWIAALGEHREAATVLEGVASEFAILGQSVNAGIALLHRAEVLLRLGPDAFDEADAELLEVQGITREIGDASAFQFELRPLTALRGYLARGHGFVGSAALLETGRSVRRARLDANHLEIDGVNAPMSKRTARLMHYLTSHPSSGWTHLRSAVFADLEEDHARKVFITCRREIEAVTGFSLEYRSVLHTYSLVWQGISLER